MKRCLFLIIITMCLAAGLIFAQGRQEAATDELQPVKITYSSITAPDSVQGLAMQRFKSEVERLSEGRITVELYLAGQIFTQEQELAATREGTLDMANYAPNWVAEFIPYMSMMGAAYTFSGYDHMRAVYDSEVGERVFRDVEEAIGVRPLVTFYLGTRQLNLIERIGPRRTPEEMRGVKLRVPSSPAWIALGRALGANPTPLSFGEVYLGLRTGVIDGQDNPITTNVAQKFYEVAKYIVLTDHVVDVIWPSMNAAKWNSLTQTDQEIIQEAAQIAAEHMSELVKAGERDLVEYLESQGTIFITDPDKEAFQEYARWSYEVESPAISSAFDWDLYDKIQDMRP